MPLVNRNLHKCQRRRDPARAAAEEREEEVEALASSFRLFFRRRGGHRRVVSRRRRAARLCSRGAVCLSEVPASGQGDVLLGITVVPAPVVLGRITGYVSYQKRKIDAQRASGDELYALQRAQRVFLGPPS